MKIPKDLQPGDRLWYSKTEYSTAGIDSHLYDFCTLDGVFSPFIWARDGSATHGGHCYMFRISDGVALNDRAKKVIHIERIASKPKKAKVDKDAAWLLRVPVEMCGSGSPLVAKRLRSIARRLNGGAL